MRSSALLFCLLAAACGSGNAGNNADAGAPDGRSLDGGTPDAGTTDGGSLDSGSLDVGGSLDGGSGDGGAPGPTVQVLARDIQFAPGVLSTGEQLRTSLVVAGSDLFFSDATDAPIKKMALAGGAPTPLAYRAGAPLRVALSGRTVFWTDGIRLFQTSLDSGATTRLADGNTSPTPALLADSTDVYWVRTVHTLDCSPDCHRSIEKISAGGASTVLAETRRPIRGLAQDASALYWEEDSLEPVSPGCGCGSQIKSVPKTGGPVTVVVDGTLNGAIPPPGPGFIPASWLPVGDVAVNGASVVFAQQVPGGFRVSAVSKAGGAIATLAQLANIPVALAADDANAFWVDGSSLSSAPLAGGATTALVTGLLSVALRLAPGSVLIADKGPTAGCCAQVGAGRILAVPREGGAPAVVAAGLDAPAALDADAATAVFAEVWRVGAAPLAGGPATTVAAGVSSALPRLVLSGDQLLVGDGQFVKAMPLAGGRLARVASAFASIGDASLQVDDLTADASAFYVAIRTVTGVGSVTRLPRDGGTRVAVSPPGFGHPYDCVHRLAIDAQRVYWASASNTQPTTCAIFSAPLTGGSAQVLLDAPFIDFVIDGANLFFTGTTVTTIDQTGSHQFGLDGVGRVAVSGGAVTSYGTPDFPSLITADPARIYYVGEIGAVASIARDGTGRSSFAEGSFQESSLLLDTIVAAGGGVYWTDLAQGTISRYTPP
jgi:hypothetical protein